MWYNYFPLTFTHKTTTSLHSFVLYILFKLKVNEKVIFGSKDPNKKFGKVENNMISLPKPATRRSGLEDGTGLTGSCSSY